MMKHAILVGTLLFASPLSLAAGPDSSPTISASPLPAPPELRTTAPKAEASPTTAPSTGVTPKPPSPLNDNGRVQDDSIFRAGGGKALRTGLTDLKMLGQLQSPEGKAFFVVSGRTCPDTACTTDIFGYSEDPKQKPVTFTYPGQIVDTKTGKVVFKARAFFGRCLPRGEWAGQEVFVTFQEERVDKRGHLQPSVFVARPGTPYWTERLLATRANRLPRIQDTLKAVKSRVCQEVPGRSRNSIKKPWQVKLPPGLEPDDAPESSPAAKPTK